MRNNQFEFNLLDIMTFQVKPFFEYSFFRFQNEESGLRTIRYYGQAQSRLWFIMEVSYGQDNVLRDQTFQLKVDEEGKLDEAFFKDAVRIDQEEFSKAYLHLEHNTRTVLAKLTYYEEPLD